MGLLEVGEAWGIKSPYLNVESLLENMWLPPPKKNVLPLPPLLLGRKKVVTFCPRRKKIETEIKIRKEIGVETNPHTKGWGRQPIRS